MPAVLGHAALVVLVLASPVVLGGCPREEDEQAVPFTVLSTCVKVPQAAEEVFRTGDELRAFWARHETRGGPPEVDFGRRVMAARFDAPGSACVGFTVEGVVVRDGRVVVSATRHVSPDPCIAVLAHPQVAVSIERTALPVVFRIAQVQGPTPAGHQACM